MNLFVICFTSAALLYVLTLPFVGKRAKKAHTEERNWGRRHMKPKRYPYCGNKKQPHEEIAELKKQIAVNKSMINYLERALKEGTHENLC